MNIVRFMDTKISDTDKELLKMILDRIEKRLGDLESNDSNLITIEEKKKINEIFNMEVFHV